jgi:hypothetical protein
MMKNTLRLAALSAVVALCVPVLAATYDMRQLEISNVSTSATSDTVVAQIAGKVERISVVASATAGLDWSIKSYADGTVLYSGTNLSDTAVSSSSNQAAFIGLELTGSGASATNKTVTATVIYSK